MKALTKKNMRLRDRKGSQIAQLGPILWLVFTMFLFPLISMSTIGMRYALLLNATRLASSAASEASTFQTDLSPSQRSATNIARAVATQAAAGFSGINLQNTATYLVVCPLVSNGTVTRQSTKLATPADSSHNSYSVEVVLSGQLQPLVPSSRGWFGNVPGLTAPITLSARNDVAFENTQGLTQ
jgi:hypothetical protein